MARFLSDQGFSLQLRLGLAILFLAVGPATSATLQSEIDAILAGPGVSGNTWSVLIERENGEVLYSRAPATPRRPASVTKLFTTVAAFDLLGPGHLWNGERIDIASRPINRNSDNTMADDLFRYLGGMVGTAYTLAEGSRVVRAWAAGIGLDTAGLTLFDGSGLSWDNRINAVQALGLFRFGLDNHPTFAATLTRACRYGTLSSRFCGTVGEGTVYGKTGTLPNGQTVSLTGFIDHGGQRFFFSFFANNATNVTASRQAIDDAVLLLTTDFGNSTVFSPGDWVRTTAGSLRLRGGPGTGFTILANFPNGTLARVRPHPDNGSASNGHSWWAVRLYPEGPDGWFAETFLASSPAPSDWPWADVVVDNRDPGFHASAAWGTADWAGDKFGPDYRFRDTAPVQDPARWSADLPGNGTYDVFAWWPAWSNRATAAPFLITHADGSTTVFMNQTLNGGRWNHLGRFEFNHGMENQVALPPWTDSGAVVMADAVRFVPIEVTPVHSLTVTATGGGTVESFPPGSVLPEGTTVKLTALPDPGLAFLGWTGDVESSQNPITLVVGSPLEITVHFGRTHAAWADSHFSPEELADPAISGDRAAPAGDGIPNLLKYALGLDPRQTAIGIPPAPSLAESPGGPPHLTLTFSHPSGLTDITFMVRLSDDLRTWEEAADLISEEKDGDAVTRVYRDPRPFAGPMRFMRLEVSR